MRRLALAVLVLLAACNGDAQRRENVTTTPARANGPVVSPTPTPPTTVEAPPAFAFPLLAAPERADAISVGGAHACLLRGGETWCWGRNEWRELGDGSTTARTSPVRATAVPAATSVAVGAAHTCTRTAGGDVWCWGDDELGQIGVMPLQRSRPPTHVLAGVATLAATGFSSCARLTSGETRCWGNMPLPAPASERSATVAPPASIGLPMGAGYACRGASLACLVSSDATVQCWGDGVGDSSMVIGPRIGPVRVAGLDHVTAIDAGDSFFCASAHDRVQCWGPHATMFLGLVGATDTTAEVLPGFDATTSLTVADRVVCAVGPSTEVLCAGWGELVDARGWVVALSGHAAPIAALGHARAVSMGTSGGCALGVDGLVRCVLWRSADWDQPPSPPS